jgi:integrase
VTLASYYGAWRAACKRAAIVKRDGLETVILPRLLGRTPHDFRRTAARNLIRAGVAQHVVMKLCGWKTDAKSGTWMRDKSRWHHL